MAVSDYLTIAQKFYVAYFGRPADPSGLANIAASLAAANAPTTTQAFVDAYRTNATVRSIIDSFGDSTESHELYVGDTKAFVTAIYQNVLGRAPDAEGLNYWAQSIDQGALGRGSAALTIMAGAESNTSSQGKVDAATVAAKIVLASQFTNALNTPAALASYSGNAAASAARAMLNELSSVTATLERLVDPVPTALDLLAADDSGSSSTDNITRQTSGLTITGLAPGAARVELFDGTTKVGSGVVTSGSFTIDIVLTEAIHTITAVGYTEGGVKSRSSAALAITVDTSAPGTELLASLVQDSGVAGDAITNNSNLLLSGLDAKNIAQYSKDGINWSSTFAPAAGANIVMVKQVDAAGNSGPVSVFKFTYDKTAPQLATSLPANGVKEMGMSSDIVLTLDDTLVVGSGDIILSDALQDRRVISMSDTSQVQVIGKTITINPTLPLNPETRYFVNLPASAVTDVAGNGVSAVNLSFTTVDATIPTLASSMPTANRSNVSPLANLYLGFSEAMKAGAGSITLSDGSDRRVISINDSTQVSISGSTVTINPTLPLNSAASYSVKVDAGALKDLSGNAFAGIASSEFTFDTASTAVSLAALTARQGYKLVAPKGVVDYSTRNFTYSGDGLGKSVAGVGDLNGDGMDDVLVIPQSGFSSNSGALTFSNAFFVVYGSGDSTPGTTDVTRMTGAAGFRMEMSDNSSTYTAKAISAGDLNGDRIPDLLIGNFFARPAGAAATTSLVGAAMVVYGTTPGSASVNIAALAGSQGYRMDGLGSSYYMGYSVGAGDINGDGFSDAVVGAPGPGYDIATGSSNLGSTFILFGAASSGAAAPTATNLDGKNGVRIDGETKASYSGAATVAGDFNADGYADIAIGARFAALGKGAAYIVFGKAGGWAPTMSLTTLSADTGLRITNTSSSTDNPGSAGIETSSAGDLNGDGYADLLVSATDNYSTSKGDAYVVFGRANDSTGKLDLGDLTGKNGFRIKGHADGDMISLTPLAAVGDVNGDGYDDLLVGAPGSDVAGTDAGSVYVIFGKSTGFAANIDITTLDAASAWRIDGAAAGDQAGYSVSSAGDVNGDGFDDIIIGAPGPTRSGSPTSGAAYIVYGRDVTGSVRYLGDSAADTLTGTTAAENFVAGNGDDTMIGGGGADAFSGGAGNDTIVLADLSARRIDGGSGTDTLRLSGASQTLDLALFRNRIDSIEVIDLTGSGNNTLKVLARDLLNLNELGNSLKVDGNAGDKVVLGAGWTDGGIIDGYHQYAQGQAVILIGVDLTITL